MSKQSIRDKLRSNGLKQLAKEKGLKRTRDDMEREEQKDNNCDTNQDDDQSRVDIRYLKEKCKGKASLLSILPKPKNSSLFGPTIKIDKLLQLPERADDAHNRVALRLSEQSREDEKMGLNRLNEDGMIEVDVSKVIDGFEGTNTAAIKELTIEKAKASTVIVPKGKEKQKNQITYLAQLGKATELERKDQAAQSRLNKAAARSKYGW